MSNKNFYNFFTISTGLILIDQITKVIFSSRDFFLLGMHFRLVKNFGLSFGLNFGSIADNLIILLALILFWAYGYRDFKNNVWGLALVTAGALSNIFDRVYLGYVRDFWDLRLGFTFNLADAFIILGLIFLLFASNSREDSGITQKNI